MPLSQEPSRPQWLRELEDIGGLRQDVARHRNILGRAHLIARQHPHLDAGGAQIREDLGHTVLQLVLKPTAVFLTLQISPRGDDQSFSGKTEKKNPPV